MADDNLNEQEKGKEKRGSGSPGKKNLMIAGVVVVVLIIAIIVLAVSIRLPVGKGTTQPEAIKNFTQSDGGESLLQTRIIRNTLLPTGTGTVGRSLTPQKIPALPVDFLLQPGDPASCGLTCRQLEASITNTGYETAHNVCITVGLHNSRNEIISLNGEPSIHRCIGDISGGQRKTEPITINADCGAFATKCIGETLTLQTRVTSVEKTVQFPDQLIAV